ncbi:sulfotransferase family 2 domain-containing protein [Lichenicoccus sp.]|uniref:sulfotransferase family 2 domain-containing protein n=1 Tax=Lichenicoccus sp. TaxID=2781899 RepID=UPI003D153172
MLDLPTQEPISDLPHERALSSIEPATRGVLFDCEDFQVVRKPGPSSFLLITFGSLGMFNETGSLADGRTFWGQELADAPGFAAIGFIAKSRNWFCSPSMEKACKLAATFAAVFETVVAYGSGMGGHGALRWGRLAGAGTAVAFSPQCPVDPALHTGIEIRREHVPQFSFVFVDPALSADQGHAALLAAAAPEIVQIPMFACGHESVRAFATATLGAEMLRLCASGKSDAVWDLANEARRASSIRTVELAMRAIARHPALAQRIFDKHQGRFDPDQKQVFVSALSHTQEQSLRALNSIRHIERPLSGTGSSPLMNVETPRLVHLHIPKTAGTALRAAFEQQSNGALRSFSHWDESEFNAIDPASYDFYSGHFGYHTASRLGGDIVTVLRHPVDRYMSVYYFWRQLYNTGVERSLNTELAARFPIEEFVQIRDQPWLIEEFENRATFQLAYGSSLVHRRQMRLDGLTNDAIFNMALRNLDGFKAVGIQEDMTRFAATIKAAYGIVLDIQKVNVTEERPQVRDISVATRRAIQDWVYMDMELYQQALRMA